MELQILETFGNIDKNIVILNTEEYAYTVGSLIMIKQLRSGERNYKSIR